MRTSSYSVLLGVALSSTLAAASGAQVTVVNTFGPGDSFERFSVNAACPYQSSAQSFTYNGPAGYVLTQLRLALYDNDTFPYNVALYSGADLNGAKELESWSVNVGLGFRGWIETLTSAIRPQLVTGDTYWISATSGLHGYCGGWMMNDRGIDGVWSKLEGGSWTDKPTTPSSAFDVTADVAITPEPTTIMLVGTGALALWPAIRRRKRAVRGD